MDKTSKTPATTIDDCRIISLERHPHNYGTLTVAQNSDELPFAIKRIYYIYDIPTDTRRGGHCHNTDQCIIVATAGCFDVTVSDGISSRTFTLRRPYEGLYVPAGIWDSLSNFSSGSIALVLSSTNFDETDYIRHFDDFVEAKRKAFGERDD
ncbi:MAG: FdtA/QdtA family cupin domain-containing protein [Paramuribaculum sp.]